MSLIATRLQNWRVENPELDRNMTRPCEYGALDFFIEQTNAANSILSPTLRDRAFASIGNTGYQLRRRRYRWQRSFVRYPG